MESIKLNETPVRTSRNFNMNNIKLEDIKIPDNIESFDSVYINSETSKIQVENSSDNKYNLTYGLGDVFTNQVKSNSNQSLKVKVDSKINKELQIDFKFDSDNSNLVDSIVINANENSKGTIIIKYLSDENKKYYHNGIIKLYASKNSNINVIVVNLLNSNSNSFISIDNELCENAKVNYTIIDFGGKNSISNYYSNLKGNYSSNSLNSIYLGKENQLFDLNYISELRGIKTNINIEAQGALKDKAVKHFKGTIDFKKGAKKAKGNENESCMLLSDTAKSLALPMLLCSEEDVEGNHSSSSGKTSEKELFYIMSRGFNTKEAMKLMVRARFNKILECIENEELKNEILNKVDERLD